MLEMLNFISNNLDSISMLFQSHFFAPVPSFRRVPLFGKAYALNSLKVHVYIIKFETIDFEDNDKICLNGWSDKYLNEITN
jgi:hypothetical protein